MILDIEKRIKEIEEKLINLQNNSSNNNNNNSNSEEIIKLEEELKHLHSLREDKDKELEEKQENISYQAFEATNSYVTSGRYPDYSITIPIESDQDNANRENLNNNSSSTNNDSREYFCLNDTNILVKMNELKVKNKKYNLFSRNCADAVKICILAGISSELKRKIIDHCDNVSEAFFECNTFETPQSVRKWAQELLRHICTLNNLSQNNQLTQTNSAQLNLD